MQFGVMFSLVSVSQLVQEIIHFSVRCHMDACAISKCDFQPLKPCLIVSFDDVYRPTILFFCSNVMHLLSSMSGVSFEVHCMRSFVSVDKR